MVETALRRLGMVCAAVIAAAYLAYVLAVPLGLVPEGDRLGVPEIILALALLAGVWLSASSYSITDLSVGSGGVSARLARAEARQSALESEVEALRVALTGVVTKYEWDHLSKLAGQEPAWVRFRQDRKLQLELERLDAMGFIEPTDLRGLNAIPQDHAGRDEEFDLRRYVTITGEGREYLALRRRLHGGG
ncbi:hypothetical protein ACFSKW_06280 [Nonomuraea mangrovi]|uniref:Uncharacterized protein n=1 Tax=Nonomuraea mangrovi TaxID=2316207 RepID=A0ABW4SND8_9ACTN